MIDVRTILNEMQMVERMAQPGTPEYSAYMGTALLSRWGTIRAALIAYEVRCKLAADSSSARATEQKP